MSHAAGAATPTGPAYAVLLALPVAGFALLAWGLSQHALPWQLTLDWVPSLGLAATFRVDGLSAQMLALITGICALVFVYAHGYLDHEPRRDRLLAILALFMLAMVGAVSADSVILLFLSGSSPASPPSCWWAGTTPTPTPGPAPARPCSSPWPAAWPCWGG